jgi:hypothetical protein
MERFVWSLCIQYNGLLWIPAKHLTRKLAKEDKIGILRLDGEIMCRFGKLILTTELHSARDLIILHSLGSGFVTCM